MNSFFKFFFASLLSLLVFALVGILILLGIISSLATPAKEHIDDKAVLVLDLSTSFMERAVENPLGGLGGNDQFDIPSLYDVVRIICQAEKDSSIKGIYIKCGTNLNGFGSSEDIRNALLHFKTSKKFIYAYADVITQGGYYVANIADKIYCNPRGGLDWRGYSMNMIYLKGTLEKLGIEPQIFYAGKFKSATEPFRESKMSDANRIQTTEILKDLYNHFLIQSAKARNLDTALLRMCATEHRLRIPADAVKYGLLDGLKYDDEVNDEIAGLLKLGKYEKINFVPIAKFAKAVAFKRIGKDKIAILYAEGDIIDGKGERDRIGSESYMNLIRKVRLDKTIKAIVFRINSGGGSAMASENIWRELSLARKEKPVILSFGDVSASGGYYLSCNADSIFAQPNTITGSIGVFSMLPNMQRFFNEKLGVTFDGVKTSPDADALSISKPLTESQRRWLQNDVDSIYLTFTSRVAEGRKKSIMYIDSIGQGRIWSGSKALELGLIDRIGGLQDAIDCAARMAKVKDYKLREYPEPENIIEKILGSFGNNAKASAVKEELGADGIKIYEAIKKVKHMSVTAQARLPFDFVIE